MFNSGISSIRYIILVPIFGYFSYRSLIEPRMEYFFIACFILVYLATLYIIDRNNEMKILAMVQDKNFFKIEIEELNNEIKNNNEIVSVLSQELEAVRNDLNKVVVERDSYKETVKLLSKKGYTTDINEDGDDCNEFERESSKDICNIG